MAGGDAVEVKAQITADVLVLTPVCVQTVAAVTEEPLDTEKLKKMPGIIGYVVKPGRYALEDRKDVPHQRGADHGTESSDGQHDPVR